MEILFIGGTSFVGRHMAEAAIARGHWVTLFHRGTEESAPLADCEHVLGDRDTDLELLAGRTWDAAVDVIGYVPRHVRQAADLLENSVERYCYVSTVSAYRRWGIDNLNEDSELLDATDLQDPETETVDDVTYGPLKAVCDGMVREAFAGRALVIRPTYCVGPYDPSDRFTYWVRRAAAGGEILAAGHRDAPIQLIDARDLAIFTISLLERRASGAYNVVGPPQPLTWGEMLDACITEASSLAEVTWVDPDFLRKRGVHVETEIPFWRIPSETVLMRCDPTTSVAAGLRHAPLERTISDTRAWDVNRGLVELKGPITDQREAELLTEWHRA